MTPLGWPELLLMLRKMGVVGTRMEEDEYRLKWERGAKKYGELFIDEDRRDWDREARQEEIDRNIYTAFSFIKTQRATRLKALPE